MGAQFEIIDLGELRYFLGIEIMRSKQGIVTCLHKYTLDQLEETGMLRVKPAGTPIEKNHVCRSGELLHVTLCQRRVGHVIVPSYNSSRDLICSKSS